MIVRLEAYEDVIKYLSKGSCLSMLLSSHFKVSKDSASLYILTCLPVVVTHHEQQAQFWVNTKVITSKFLPSELKIPPNSGNNEPLDE
mmetsp:Transcript_31254/g.38621  ORF Transcript_31254/g.38621 Transcript_31254/m.38621 type:complete len:88 (+) Transcript_31254:98-361(+)